MTKHVTDVMEKKKKIIKQPVITLPEKHPLEEPPVDDSVISEEEDLDKIPDEEEEEVPPYEPPVPGEGP